MAIDLETKTVEIKEQDRTLEFIVSTPANGAYTLSIYRHTIDKNTKKELSRDAAPIVLNLAEMAADPDIGPLLASLPPILDRIVTAKRAALAAEIAAALAAAQAPPTPPGDE